MNWINLVASIASIIGFLITLWQLFSFKKKLKKAIILNNNAIEKTLRVISVTDSKRLAEYTLDLIINNRFELAISKLIDLNKAVIDICESLNRNNCAKLSQLQMNLPSDLANLREIYKGSTHYYIHTIVKDIQLLLDELQRIESSIKKIKNDEQLQ